MSDERTIIADRYRLIRLIGSGGMGVVWEGWDERLHRAVAVKLLRTEHAETEREATAAKNRAMREARIMARVHHPHVVQVFDAVEHEGRPCLVMQYLPSTSLAEVLKEGGPLTLERAARLGAEVASALAAAHRHGVVHRDVKPANILIAEDGNALITDFGISHALGDSAITSTGLVRGTPAYLAPEVARGEESSFRSDVYSLGSTLYAALEGEPPFGTDNNSLAVLHKVAVGDFPPPRNAGPLTEVILEMLSDVPGKRPSMKAVARRLSALWREVGSSQGEDEPTLVMVPSPTVGSEDTTVRLTPASPDDDETERLTATPPPTVPLGGKTERISIPSAPPTPTATSLSVPAPSLAARQPRRRMTRWLAAGLVALVGLTLLVLSLMRAADPGGSEADDPVTAETPPAVSQSPSTPEDETSQPVQPLPETPVEPEEPEEPDEGDGGATAADPAGAIVGYYELVPGNLDEAWVRMTSEYQAFHAGGREGYDEFWSAIERVEVSNVVVLGPDQVQATLTYYYGSGRVDVEDTLYTLVSEEGMLKIAASEVLSSRSV